MTVKQRVLVSMKRDLAAVKARPIRRAPEPSNKLSARDEKKWDMRWAQFWSEIRNHEIKMAEARIRHYQKTGEIQSSGPSLKITP